MCGLITVVERARPVNATRFRNALLSLRHRGPDAVGSCDLAVELAEQAAPCVHVALGHTRLAVLDLDPRANQPFTDGRRSIVYNGEIYNFPALREQGGSRGWATTSDTEVLLWLLGEHGPGALGRCNGMWAFTCLDAAEGHLLAARDRYGKKPLFYRLEPDRAVFASTIAAILAYSGDRPRLVPEARDAFLAEGWLLPDATGGSHIAGIRQVKAGHALTLDLASWTVTERLVAPLDFGSDPPPDADAPASSDELASLLADSVSTRLVSDRRIGLMLSGGVDSSLILSVLHARDELDRVTCITGDAGKSEDAAFARAALAAVGRDALVVPIDYGAGSVDDFLDVCVAQEKPFPLIGNVLGLPALYRAIAEADIRVVLDGTGADEIFAGYWTRQAGFAVRDALRAGDTGWVRAVTEGGMLPAPVAAFARAGDPEAALPSPLTEALEPEDLAFLLPASRAALAPPAVTADPLVGFDGTLAGALRRDITAGRLPEWLWQNDRSAMRFGVENRSPFLDPRLARFVASGYRAKLDGGWNKRQLRGLFAHFTELPTASRREKQGFRWVYGRFLRNNGARLLELLAASRVAAACADMKRLVDAAHRDPRVMERRLMQRLLPLAGLEARGLIAP